MIWKDSSFLEKKHVLRRLDPSWTNHYSLLEKADFENGLRFVAIKCFNSPDKGCDGEIHLPCCALMLRTVLLFAKPDTISNCRFTCLHATHSFHLWLVLWPRSFTVEWKSAVFQPTFSFLRDVMHALHFYIHCTGYLVLWHGRESCTHVYFKKEKKGQSQMQRLCKQNIFCMLFLYVSRFVFVCEKVWDILCRPVYLTCTSLKAPFKMPSSLLHVKYCRAKYCL